jgi:cytochrome oxidase Cu insertion factor (SCO1/SenC/PrrC family)
MAPVGSGPCIDATGRRAALSCTAAGIAALLLAACDRPGQGRAFQSIDLTGADWGRDFSLLDADGRTVRPEATAKAFKVFYRKVPTGSSYTMDHTATSYVFDPTGRLRLAVRHEQDAASVASDIARLLEENP